MFKRFTRLAGAAMLVVVAALLITSLALAYSANFDELAMFTPVDGLTMPGMTFSAIPGAGIFPAPPGSAHTSGNIAYASEGWIEITFDEPQDFVSFSYAYEVRPGLPVPLSLVVGHDPSPWQPWIYGELDGEMVVDEQLPPGQLFLGSAELVGWYEARFTLDQRVDLIAISSSGNPLIVDNIETGVNPVVDPTPEPTDEPTAEPTEEPTEAPAPMLCTLGDGSLNALHCGRPVAVFAKSGGFNIYGVDINTGNGSLAEEVTEAMIEVAGVPSDSPMVIAQGQNPYNFRPFTLYRLPGGEFQLNTYYWDGKPYVIKWAAGDNTVSVVEW